MTMEAVIFDFDGVLIDSEPLMRLAFAHAYEAIVGAPDPPIEEYLEYMGLPFAQIMDELGLSHDLGKPYFEFCKQNAHRVRAFSGALETLLWGRDRAWKLALFTGKNYRHTMQLLQHFGWMRHFEIVVTSDQLTRPKPHPEGILKIIDALGTRAEKAVMVGDSVSDIVSAQRAGVRAVAVTWGTKPERLRRLCSPDAIVDDFDGLREVLDSWSTRFDPSRGDSATTFHPGWR